MKVLFALHDLGFADHISIAHLSAIAKQSGHETFFTLLDSFIPQVIRLRPDVVAYSTNILGFKRVVEANLEARKRHRFIAIMGGAHPTVSPETFGESGMDAYCVGEGDYVFRDFLANINDYQDIPNLITRYGTNSLRPLIRNIDELPPADRDLVLSNSFLKNSAKKTFYATRGCPFSCAYCCNNYIHKIYKGQPTVRRFSVERIIREIEDARSKYRMDFVKFGDDCFAIRADEWLEEFAFKYRGRIGKPFNCYLRIDTIDDAMLRLLQKARCYSVNLSVDSVNPDIRENVLNRKMKSNDVVERLRKVKEYGINTFVNYMLAAPESTLQDDLDTIRQGREGKVTWINYTTTVPMEKTDLYDYCLSKGVLPDGYIGDMSGCDQKTALSCFSGKDKNIRLNIFFLGEWLAKFPFFMCLLKLPPNRLFRKFNAWRYRWHMEHKIFKVNDKMRVPRFWSKYV